MKITNAEIIKNGERDLIDAITADLDWGAIEKIFLKEHNLGIEEDIEYKSGDIIALENQIAYKLEFEVKVSLSVILDRNGNYISVSIKGKPDNNESDQAIGTENSEPLKGDEEKKGSEDEITGMESKVDVMLENINRSSKTE
jgi:hypothetical protein